MFLVLSALAVVVFATNVALGAMSGGGFLGDVGEMLVLLTASVLFVVAILQKEADRKTKRDR